MINGEHSGTSAAFSADGGFTWTNSVSGANHGVDKLGFGMFESTFSFCENLLTLLIGLSPLLWSAATRYATSYELVNKDSSLVYTEIIQSALFLEMVQIINEVIYVWLSLYSTFVIEEKHGFNKTTLSTFSWISSRV